VSCAELDLLVDVARECGVTGARMMGGGFGGCTINVVAEESFARFMQQARSDYTNKFGREPAVYEVIISEGARRLT
jgi:galactokinase